MAGANDDKKDDKSDDNKGDKKIDPNTIKLDDPVVKEAFDKLVKDQVAEALKPIKEKLDGAYGSRDEALKKLAEIEQEKKDAELKRLKEEGKHKEAHELEMATERAKTGILEKKNIELTRDIEVRQALSGLEFRNDNALEMAYREIVPQLVKNEQGIWMHRSGGSIRDHVKSFADAEANSFLFKVKSSSGAGTGGGDLKIPDKSSGDKKSLFSMSQDEVLKLAAEGKLPTQRL